MTTKERMTDDQKDCSEKRGNNNRRTQNHALLENRARIKEQRIKINSIEIGEIKPNKKLTNKNNKSV
jgi:hypothetical protein